MEREAFAELSFLRIWLAYHYTRGTRLSPTRQKNGREKAQKDAKGIPGFDRSGALARFEGEMRLLAVINLWAASTFRLPCIFLPFTKGVPEVAGAEILKPPLYLMKKLLFTLAATFSLLASAQAGIFNYAGTTVGSPVWNRPVAGTPPTALSGVGTATPFDRFAFTVDLSGSYTFVSTSVTPVNWDNYTFLYQMAFNPATPLTNALTGNDDNPSIGRSGFTFSLNAGTQYFFITTGFGNADTGSFANSISGAGNTIPGIVAVPEPATVFASLGALGLCLTAVRRSRQTKA